MVEVAWSASSLLFLAASLLSATAAMLVYRSRRWDRLNRWVASLLAIEAGIFLLTCAHVLVQDATTFRWIGALITIGIVWVSISQLQVVGQLPTRLSAWLRSRPALWSLVAAGSAVTATILVRPELAIADLLPSEAFAYTWQAGPLREGVLLLFLATHLFALLAALHAWRSAEPGSRTRRSGGIFAAVFGFRDVSLFVLIAVSPLAQSTARAELLFFVMFAVANIMFLGLLSYAVLQDQFLDINIRIKTGIRRSLVASAFAVAFFVGSELVEQFIPVDGIWIGVAAAGAITLALRRLEALATAAADRLMPGVSSGSDYLEARKVEVYQAALETVYRDGGVTKKEETMLEVLREKLGIGDREIALLHQRIGQHPRTI